MKSLKSIKSRLRPSPQPSPELSLELLIITQQPLNKIERALQRGFKPKKSIQVDGKHFCNMLDLAVYINRKTGTEVLELLIMYGIRPTAESMRRVQDLDTSVAMKIAFMELFIQSSPSLVNYVNRNKESLLQWACIYGTTNFLKLLLESGADTSYRHPLTGNNALFYALKSLSDITGGNIQLLLDNAPSLLKEKNINQLSPVLAYLKESINKIGLPRWNLRTCIAYGYDLYELDEKNKTMFDYLSPTKCEDIIRYTQKFTKHIAFTLMIEHLRLTKNPSRSDEGEILGIEKKYLKLLPKELVGMIAKYASIDFIHRKKQWLANRSKATQSVNPKRCHLLNDRRSPSIFLSYVRSDRPTELLGTTSTATGNPTRSPRRNPSSSNSASSQPRACYNHRSNAGYYGEGRRRKRY